MIAAAPLYHPAMRTRLVFPLLLIVILSACGGTTATNANPPTTGNQTSTSQPTKAPAGKVDCAKIKTAAVELLGVQFMAQLNDKDTVEAVRAKQMGNFDPDTFLAAMHELHALDSYASPVLGDPKPAIDFYEKAATAAKTLFATDPITQAAIDTYNLNVGTAAAFLGHQTAIAGAMSEAGC